MIILAIDFDGTIVDHVFPDIGAPCPGAFHWLRRFQELGAGLILWTMRSAERQNDGDVLAPAVEFCRENGVEFFGVNENPGQASWTASPKAYAHVYIDDAAFGCPLKDNPRMGGRPFVDWRRVGPAVQAMILAESGKGCPACGGWGLEEPDPDSGKCATCDGTGEFPEAEGGE